MSSQTACISIPVDLSNPGHFFACCGLFELADRLWWSAEVRAHFEPGRFFLRSCDPTCSVDVLLREFARAECIQLDPSDNAASALMLSPPFNLRLDWWWKPDKNQLDRGGGGKLKTWAGKQFGPLIFRLMKEAAADAALENSPLDYGAAVFDAKDGKAKSKTVSPFYFDCRREGTCLDLGFSPDEQDMSVESYPAVESLSLVGIQRFRPSLRNDPRSFEYTAWTESLPIVVAAAACCRSVPVRSCGTFRFTKPSRGGEYMTMFSRATLERSNNV